MTIRPALRVAAVLSAATMLFAAACSAPAATAPPVDEPPTTTATPAPLGTGNAAVPRLRWVPCHGGFQCTTATVPLSYREPTGAKLDLSVIRLPATDPAHRMGSLMINFGGPGADGVGELTRFGSRYPKQLRARFDLVSFDPRGIGGSSPIHCPGGDQAPSAGSPLRDKAFWTKSAAIGKACAAGSGAELAHLSTANVARDMDLLRQALGEPQLNFYGYSYGTYLGGTYANLFPGNLRAMTLDGTLDLVANATGRPGEEGAPVDVRADVASAQQEELDAFFAACTAAGPGKCAFAGGNPKEKFASLYARLTHGPVGGVTVASLMQSVDRALYQWSRWPRLARTLAALVPSKPASPAPVLDPRVPAHSPGFLAVQCLDSDLPQDPETYRKLATTEERRQRYFGLAPVFSMAQCLGWPARDDDRYLGPWNRPRQHPALILANRHDPATPLANAQATAGELGDSRVLVVEGAGHTTLDVPSTCASTAMVRYFVDLAPPASGTTCAPDAGPFP
ncbi:alpha/beta hydrolase [Amycolatopsis jiangsuensis]|uniref:Pimeloyl-ACP methyl ester carboxylesterase n=1 Tax=Amycolatopsis jiangsuensis TaxID=1181879 RepID=A0A840IQ55_9PSEU|nr:alpha/beta hydrolase [Amycolatopsis jiangsuensis]MBB4684671.1 pimeloyl-ACP methyl ester carboxylesterase [Amycolatopsis jiangsuensis]